ncbi:MAG: hypothetical protein JW739_05755 [Opitutales bacterium]|nr:hypothetical protein [Opitutales bacterium]
MIDDAIIDLKPEDTEIGNSSELDQLVDDAYEAVRSFQRTARKAAMDYVDAGRKMSKVKDYLLSPSHEILSRENGQFSREGHVSFTVEKGWQSLCSERLGLSYKTADRYIADYNAYELLSLSAEKVERAKEYLDEVNEGNLRATKALEAFEAFKQLPEPAEEETNASRWAGLEGHLKTQAEIVIFREMETAALAGDRIAANELEQAALGHIPITRAHSGWKGGIATKGKTRRDPSYAHLIVKNSTTLLNAWRKFYDIPMEERRAATDSIVAVMTAPDLPDEVGREIFQRLADKYGKGAFNG